MNTRHLDHDVRERTGWRVLGRPVPASDSASRLDPGAWKTRMLSDLDIDDADGLPMHIPGRRLIRAMAMAPLVALTALFAANSGLLGEDSNATAAVPPAALAPAPKAWHPSDASAPAAAERVAVDPGAELMAAIQRTIADLDRQLLARADDARLIAAGAVARPIEPPPLPKVAFEIEPAPTADPSSAAAALPLRRVEAATAPPVVVASPAAGPRTAFHDGGAWSVVTVTINR